MPNGRSCCICAGPLKGIGCRADPFRGGMCCDDCKDRYVEPVRKIFGEAITVNMLNVLRSLARESRYIREQRAISQAMREIVEQAIEEKLPQSTPAERAIAYTEAIAREQAERDQLADEDDPSEEAIRDG